MFKTHSQVTYACFFFISEIISLVGGNNGHIVALSKDYKVYAWGSNKYKIIGDSSDDNVLVPTHIPLSGKVKKVAVGGRHNLAITVDLKVFAWGDNSDGQLGTGDNTSSSKPIPSGKGEMGKNIFNVCIYLCHLSL